MEKKRILLIIAEAAFILSIMIFSLYYMKSPGRLTGFTIFESQPDSSTGKDTYLRESSDNNYGTDTTLKIGKTAGGVEFRGLVEFNLSSIPSSDTVTSAILSLYLSSSSNNNNITIKAYRTTSEWNQTAAGWNNRTASNLWSSAGGDYSEEITSIIFTNISGEFNFTITSVVQGWVNGSYNNSGLLLISEDAANGDYKEISASEHATASQRPKLTVDYTANAVPTLVNITTNTNTTNFKQVGENVTFTTYWTDAEGDDAKVLICNSTNLSHSLGCGDTTFCNTSFSSTSPITCSYTVTAAENRTTNFSMAVCDSANCSSINQSYFYMNHLPSVLVIDPNGGETVNQSIGNYTIKFNVSDADSDALTANLYYGESQNSTDHPIILNLNLTSSCTDPDSDTSTTNNCSYPWNSQGIYGTYFLIITVNDSYIAFNDSSDAGFNVSSIVDSEPPNITAQWTESYIYSGKQTSAYANITESYIDSVWLSLNFSSTNITMTNASDTTYNATFTAPEIGAYKFKVYAKDKVNNLNDSMPWQEFSVVKPNASAQTPQAPSSALPYHTIKITGKLNATDSLRDISATLNTPDGFTFLQNYSQTSFLGNFSGDESKTATWFVSVPITESTYTSNTTYTDYYSNSWNSTNFNITVTSAIGAYTLTASGYPEVETSGTYYTEAFFEQNGVYKGPDSITIFIYDAAGSSIVGPVAMTQESTGIYNYTYSVGASATEGQWETRINATKSGTVYNTNQFWKVVGGPFDVRSIVIDNSAVNNLQISVTAENTGGANKDLTLTWNLTRTDTDAILDSGADTFMVNANSERTWTISPSTTYVGQVKITFLGYYSTTEKAGAYEIFTTTAATAAAAAPSAGGGGGGGAAAEKKEDFTINAEETTYLTKNIEETISLIVNNTGQKTLNNLSLELENLDDSDYTLTPKSINSLKTGKTAEFKIKFFITDFVGEKEFSYKITTNELTKKQSAKIIVLSMKDYFSKEMQKLKNKINNLKENIQTVKDENKKQDLLDKLKNCEELSAEIESNIEKEEFINAKNNIKEAEDCIEKVEDKFKGIREIPIVKIKMVEYWAWIITWILILLLIAALAFIIWLLHKKLGILSFLKSEQTQPQTAASKKIKKEYIDKKIENIEEKLKE